MSLTTQVFGTPKPGYYRVYYNVPKRRDLAGTIRTTPHPMVLMFWADWNEPCRVMLKPYRDMALASKDKAVFCRVDVDKHKDLVVQYKVEALPTFVLIKNNTECRRVVGAKVEELYTTIKNNI